MNLKNKLLSAGLAACMVVPMAMPVCANEVNPATNDSQSTTLHYEVGSHYTWTIHSGIDFGKDGGTGNTLNGTVKTGEQKVKVTENVIEEGKKLHITAAGSGGDSKAFSVKIKDGVTTLNYAVKSGENAVDVNGTVLDVNAGTNADEVAMEFKLSTTTDTAEKAGTYEGTITYSASVVNQAGA